MSAGYRRGAVRTAYENRWLRFEAHEMTHPGGTAGEHGVVVTPPASAVVVLDGADVLLTRQPRYAVDRVVLEVVKGGSDPGEDALACAVRETREELGIAAARWDALGVVYEIPSIVAHPVALFLARELTRVDAAHEDVESIEPVRLPFDEALRRCETGELADAVTAVALLRARRRLAED